MAQESWHYLENQFDNTTKNSRRRLHEQGVFHQNTLVNAPGAILSALTSRFNTTWQPFTIKYGQWLNLRGQLKAATQTLEENFTALSADDIESIETDFKAGHKRGSAPHTSAFPQGREPFQSGTQDQRMGALGVLVTRIGQLVGPLEQALADAQTANAPQPEINAAQLRVLGMQAAQATALARQASINGARATQDGLESSVSLAADALEPLRVALADTLYANMLQLALHFFPLAQRPQVEAFFNLELLQHHEPDEEEPPVVPVPPVP